MGLRWLFSFLALPLGLAACSGASSSEIPAPTTTESTTEPTPREEDGEHESATSTSTSTHDSGTTPAPPPDAKDAPPPAPPAPPAPACAVEVENNESASRANTFTGCITGKLASSKDSDYLRIVAPANAHTMLIEHKETEGKILYRVSEEGELPVIAPTVTFTEEAPPVQVTPGAAYLFKLTFPAVGHGGGSRPYALEVTFR